MTMHLLLPLGAIVIRAIIIYLDLRYDKHLTIQNCPILLTSALPKLKVFLAIPLACLARELLSIQGKLVNNNKHTY